MRIDWREFLFKEFPDGKLVKGRNGEEYNIDCISPSCPNPKKHLFINISSHSDKHDKRFHCKRCGYAGNHRAFLISYFNLPYLQILDNLSDLYGLEESPFTLTTKNIKDFNESLNYEEEEEDNSFIIDLPIEFKRLHKNTKFLNNRNFPEWTLKRFKIGTCKSGYYKDRIIFPIRTGRSRSFLAYSQDSKKKLKTYKRLSKKYTDNKNFWNRSRKILYPSKSITSMLLFNYFGIKKYEPLVIIVEGVMDAIRMIDLGYNAVAKLGGFLSDEQCKLLSDKDIGELVYMPDSDVSEKDIKKSIDRLKEFCDSDISYVKLKSGDPDDIRSGHKLTQILDKRIRKNSFYIKNDSLTLFN
jgi:DNA primase